VAGDEGSLALACPLGLARVAFEKESKIPLFIAVKTRLFSSFLFFGGVPGKSTRRPQKVEQMMAQPKVITVITYYCKNVRTIIVMNACLIIVINACVIAAINACLIIVINACLIAVINGCLIAVMTICHIVVMNACLIIVLGDS